MDTWSKGLDTKTPLQLADELALDVVREARRMRRWLRKNYGHTHKHGAPWHLSPEVAERYRGHFHGRADR